jgi:hypothetical protein
LEQSTRVLFYSIHSFIHLTLISFYRLSTQSFSTAGVWGRQAADLAAKETWDVLSQMKTDGHVVPNNQGFKAIKSTKIGKIGEMMGDLKWIWATELAKADGGETTEGLMTKYFVLRPHQLAQATNVNAAEFL